MDIELRLHRQQILTKSWSERNYSFVGELILLIKDFTKRSLEKKYKYERK